MEEEEKKVNWSSPESGYTKEINKEINYEPIIDEAQKLPFGVVPITWKDGTTTYSYRNKEYTNINEIPAFTRGNVTRYDWIDKAGEFAGNLIQSSPTLRTVLPPVAKGLSLLEMPGETNFATMVGDGAENWGIDRRIGETLAYLVYPGAGELRPASKFLSQLDDVLVNPNYGKFNKNWQINRVNLDSSFKIKGSSSSGSVSSNWRQLNTDLQFKNKKTLLGQLTDQTEANEIAENLLKHIDEGEKGLIPGWKVGRPTTRYKGKRLVEYTKKDGTKGRLYLNYSASNNSIVAIDYGKRLETKIARDNWNINSNSSLGKQADQIWSNARQRNKDLRALLADLEKNNPEEFRRIFGTKGVWYVEHLHAQNSPFWDKPRPFAPRDPKNLMALGEKNFPTLKTNIENHIYTDKWQDQAIKKYGTKIYLDYNPKNKTLQLVRADTDEAIGAIINGDTPFRNWKKSLKDAELGISQGDISQIAPDLDPVVDATDKITEITNQRLPDVGSQPGISKVNQPYNLNKEVLEEIKGYEAQIAQAEKNLEVYYSQFEIKNGKLIKTQDSTSMKVSGRDSVNTNTQLIADLKAKVNALKNGQGSLLNSKPGVTKSSGSGLMTNVQQEVPTVKKDLKIKPKKVKKKKIDDR